jgi:protein-disulfide isomerase
VHVYFKELPLESIHPWAKAAAMAGRCVYRQSNDSFWEFHDWIFAHQGEITPENLKAKVMEWAKGKNGLDGGQLGACIDSKATEADINKSMADGRALGVDQTPTLFVNGRRLGGAIDWNNLRSIIDYEIEYQKTAKNAGEDCGCELKLDLPGMTQKKTLPLAPQSKKK